MNVVIYPAGAWGTALGIHLQRIGHTVTLMVRDSTQATRMATARENDTRLPGFPLDPSIQIGIELLPALLEAEVLLIACPTRHLRTVCREAQDARRSARSLKAAVLLCKGLELDTLSLPSAVAEAEMPGLPVLVLSGPSFARGLAEGQPGAQVLASGHRALLAEIQHAFSGGNLRLYSSSDCTGVQLGGALKNIYAIASGICDGIGMRDNPKAALLTRALAEMVRVGVALGGRVETFYGLSGFGDLVLTCNGRESRNRTFGELVARKHPDARLAESGAMTVEGYRTCQAMHALCLQKGLYAPILSEIHAMLFCQKRADEALRSLLDRDLKSEDPFP